MPGIDESLPFYPLRIAVLTVSDTRTEDIFEFCFPGSTAVCRDAWDLVLALELDSRYRPCSRVGQIPRVQNICA